jgi:hypothetical protein
MGEIYEMEFVYLENGEKKRNSRLVKIPEDIPRGKMAVIDVNVTEKQDRWWERPQTLRVTVRRNILTPHMSLYVWDSKWDHPQKLQLDSKGQASVTLDRLGGDLRLASTKLPPPPAMQHRKFTLPVWYVKSVTKREIVFPDDADLVMEKTEAVDFRLKLSGAAVQDRTAAVGLVASRRSKLALAHARLHKTDQNEVRLSCAPGTYYVAAYDSNSSAWGSPSAMRRVSNVLAPRTGIELIGKVTIKRSDAGSSVEMEPR